MLRVWMVCGLAAAASGCFKAPEAVFSLSEETHKLIPEARKPVEAALKEKFGTPHTLVMWEKFPVNHGGQGPAGKVIEAKAAPTKTSFAVELPPRDGGWSIYREKKLVFTTGANQGKEAVISTLEGEPHRLTLTSAAAAIPAISDEFIVQEPGWRLKDGRELFMRHCMHCHGVAGDGNGTTARYINPRPRDFRQGKFKFTSTKAGMKVNRADLRRTLQEGVPGTSMPSFVLLTDAEQEAIIEYVRWLSMRGEYEKQLVAELSGDYSENAIEQRAKGEEGKTRQQVRSEVVTELNEYLKSDFADITVETADNLAANWEEADQEESVIWPRIERIDPVADPESIVRGRKLYMSEALKCYTCHGLGAKGDGVSTVDYWPVPGVSPERKYEVRGLHDDWGRPQTPRNLTAGIYRGGRRPLDLYRRVFAGIKGTQMAAFENALKEDKDAQGNPLTPEQQAAVVDRKIWDIVNYVLDVPFQEMTTPPLLQASGPAAPAGG